ncbi:MAG TPA: hypothetical protein VJL07_02370 [Dehalococcoidia bacterium]|nr:hypothetical protein [Dehalococcoidia bacterium]
MDTIQEARQLADLAGISLPSERGPALAGGYEGVRRIAEVLSRRDYGEAGPAFHFRPPAPRST